MMLFQYKIFNKQPVFECNTGYTLKIPEKKQKLTQFAMQNRAMNCNDKIFILFLSTRLFSLN